MQGGGSFKREGGGTIPWDVGRVLDGRYRLERPLGEGGMGTVWVAHQIALQRSVAVKSLRVTSESLRGRLRQEALAMASVRHPAIVQVFDFGQTPENEPYIVMELVEGESLAARLERSVRLSVDDAIGLMLPLLEGLAVVHAAGIVHRDIKPENVLLAVHERGILFPRLVDFGIAHVERAVLAGALRERAIVGTPAYMSPEQVTGTKVDQRTDVWAAAVLLYEMLTGMSPFQGADVVAILQSVLNDAPIFPRDVQGFDGKLWRILMAALRKSPEERTGSVEILRNELVAWNAMRRTTKTPTTLAAASIAATRSEVATVSHEGKTSLSSPAPSTPSTPSTPTVPATPTISTMDILIRGKLGDN